MFQPEAPPATSRGGLRGAVAGDVLFDRASRGRYATDASIYQVEPIGVLVPRTDADVRAAFDVCRELGVPLLPRGGGSSQCGQTVGAALVVDHTQASQPRRRRSTATRERSPSSPASSSTRSMRG